MKGRSNLTVAIVFAKEELNEFKRCSFPVLGRPVASYPILAALNSNKVDKVYLSTGSEKILALARSFPNLEIIQRESECETISEEIHRSVSRVIEKLGEQPTSVVLLLGNSPCVLSETVDNAVAVIESKLEIDSVVTVEKRHEFNPAEAFRFTERGFLEQSSFVSEKSYNCFVNGRLIVTRTKCLLALKAPFDNLFAMLGKTIYPLFQEEGITDIDYAWQVPLVERWLRENSFSEKETPYPEGGRTTSSSSLDSQRRMSAKTQQDDGYKVFISTVPFGEIDPYPVDLLRQNPRCEFVINPSGRKLKEDELVDIIEDYDILIAGTEPITARVIDSAKSLKLISRVGIGLDSVDLLHARKKGIKVSYTPDAPAPAVAELTIGLMLNACRRISLVDRKLRSGVWQRIMGRRLLNEIVGIVGTGRVGSRVLKHLQGFSPKRILVNDIRPDKDLYALYNAELVSKDVLYKESDIITLHVPLTPETRHLISREEIEKMKKSAILINTSRGGVINEGALSKALRDGRIAAASLDVFEDEPYGGELTTLENCFFTCHMGSCTTDCRFEMEKLATEEAVRFINGQKLELLVPESEYEMREG